MDIAAALRIPGRTLLLAAAAVAAIALLVGGVAWALGPAVAQAAYLGVMFLLGPAHKLPLRALGLAAAWAVAVAALGAAIGPLGVWALLPALVLVCLVQGAFARGDAATLTRSPANLVAFTGVAGSAALWQAPLGVAIGAGITALLVWAVARPQPVAAVPPLLARLRSGAVLALGCVLLALAAELLGLPRLSWALLSLCLMLDVNPVRGRGRMLGRIGGTVAGALAAVLAAQLLSGPALVAAALACAVLCVAFLQLGRYPQYVAFLTPAILLLSVFGSDATSPQLGAERIIAVLAAAAVALALQPLLRQQSRSPAAQTTGG